MGKKGCPLETVAIVVGRDRFLGLAGCCVKRQDCPDDGDFTQGWAEGDTKGVKELEPKVVQVVPEFERPGRFIQKGSNHFSVKKGAEGYMCLVLIIC